LMFVRFDTSPLSPAIFTSANDAAFRADRRPVTNGPSTVTTYLMDGSFWMAATIDGTTPVPSWAIVLLTSETLQPEHSEAIFDLKVSEKTFRIGKSFTLSSRTLALPPESATTQLAMMFPLSCTSGELPT